MTPRNVGSEATLLANGAALAPSPSLSNSSIVTLQLGLAALNFFTASLAPSREGTTRPALPPDRAPNRPILPPHLAAVPPPEFPDFWQPVIASAAMIAMPPSMRRFRLTAFSPPQSAGDSFRRPASPC